jgi:hypothetical protein
MLAFQESYRDYVKQIKPSNIPKTIIKAGESIASIGAKNSGKSTFMTFFVKTEATKIYTHIINVNSVFDESGITDLHLKTEDCLHFIQEYIDTKRKIRDFQSILNYLKTHNSIPTKYLDEYENLTDFTHKKELTRYLKQEIATENDCEIDNISFSDINESKLLLLFDDASINFPNMNVLVGNLSISRHYEMSYWFLVQQMVQIPMKVRRLCDIYFIHSHNLIDYSVAGDMVKKAQQLIDQQQGYFVVMINKNNSTVTVL